MAVILYPLRSINFSCIATWRQFLSASNLTFSKRQGDATRSTNICTEGRVVFEVKNAQNFHGWRNSSLVVKDDDDDDDDDDMII